MTSSSCSYIYFLTLPWSQVIISCSAFVIHHCHFVEAIGANGFIMNPSRIWLFSSRNYKSALSQSCHFTYLCLWKRDYFSNHGSESPILYFTSSLTSLASHDIFLGAHLSPKALVYVKSWKTSFFGIRHKKRWYIWDVIESQSDKQYEIY